jgi:hypothetical protein
VYALRCAVCCALHHLISLSLSFVVCVCVVVCVVVSAQVVAVILNVAQRGVSTPWPLVIEDHGGHEHTLHMTPGQMLLYESARLVHGRPTPLDGDSYVNLFVHFKPKTGWAAADVAEARWK